MTKAKGGGPAPAFAVTPHRQRFATSRQALVDWPSAFGRRFLVTVDVEEEFDWSRPPGTVEGSVRAIAALPEFHDRMAALGVCPAYMVDHPVAGDAEAAATLRSLAERGAEIGAQLHPWVTPPLAGAHGEAASFAGNLPRELEAAKLATLVTAVEQATGRRPRSYRAGRYGLGPGTVALLTKLGFRADLSMRARHDYRPEGGPDFTHVGNAAFRLAPGLIELPLSTFYVGRWRGRGPRWHPALAGVPKGRGVAARLGLISRVPLTPEGTSAREAIAAIDAAVADDERLLQIAFHSPSLVPGNTPYVRNAADRERFDAWWDQVLGELKRVGFAPTTIGEVLHAAG